ncbi:MAG TPA: ABC transporter permease [Chloroflexota bacterium]|nr:ABC transporter permease [Chloroflexota bacterium]
MIRPTIAIARRELAAYFASPMAYVIAALFLVVAGYFFSVNVIFSRQATVSVLFQTMYTILLLLSPALTMRLLSEEQKSGTIELLMTAPVREWYVVLGKFLAGFVFLCSMVALTAFYPLLLAIFGNPDVGGIIGGYLGAILFCAAIVSVGLFASSLTQNQIVAAVLTFTILLLLWVIDSVSSIFGGPIGSALAYLAMYPHFNDMTRGVIDTKDIVYYVTMVVGALFLTWRSLEARRWKA